MHLLYLGYNHGKGSFTCVAQRFSESGAGEVCDGGGGGPAGEGGGHVLNPHYATSLLCPVLKKLSLFGTF